MTFSIDFIGDLHGHAAKLVGLLEELGYRERSGAWRHPSRTAVFLGDLIDRGPEQLETVRIVRSMVDAGSARCVLGNHEFNALAWATEDPARPGRFLRSHSDEHRRQHQEFLAAAGEGSPLHRELLGWFASLPLTLDLGPARVVHACWDADAVRLLEDLTGGGPLGPELLAAASARGTAEFDALELLLKGPEARLPDGHAYFDKEQILRTRARFAWWHQPPLSMRSSLLIPGTATSTDGGPAPELPDLPLLELPCAIYTDQVPVFVGHYWRTGDPHLLSPMVVCVDFSAGRGGPLAAYRWDGEPDLSPDRFVLVP